MFEQSRCSSESYALYNSDESITCHIHLCLPQLSTPTGYVTINSSQVARKFLDWWQYIPIHFSSEFQFGRMFSTLAMTIINAGRSQLRGTCRVQALFTVIFILLCCVCDLLIEHRWMLCWCHPTVNSRRIDGNSYLCYIYICIFSWIVNSDSYCFQTCECCPISSLILLQTCRSISQFVFDFKSKLILFCICAFYMRGQRHPNIETPKCIESIVI